MKSIREILRLSFSCQLSGRQIATALGLSRAAVWDCLRRAHAANLSWPLPDEIDETQLYARMYTDVSESCVRPQPDCLYIFNEYKRKGVTLSLLWEEYKRENPTGYQYTKFCGIYSEWLERTNLVMRQEHKAGQKAFSDFSGGTLNITDPSTGEVVTARLFVCALGASSFTYAEPFFSESAQSWCTGQANAFSYFGLCPEIVVPDNPRAVVSKACAYEPEINPDFLVLAEHFGIAVIPARVRRPKDKAVVEAAVGLSTRWILARLRNHTFFSLAEANAAVRELVNDLNDRPFKKIPGCRRSLFESIDKPAMKPLPTNRYEYTHVQYAKANIDYHIEVEKCFYSVPHQLVGKRLEVRAGITAIEVFWKGRRIASHPKCPRPGQAHTLDEHMPKAHRAYKGWSPERIISWSAKIGPATAHFVQEMMSRKKYPELAYRASLGLIRLAKLHTAERLEAACERATAVGCYSYKNVKLILQNNMDSRPLPSNEPAQLRLIDHKHIRGANYFSQKKENENVDSSDPRTPQELETVRHGQSTGTQLKTPDMNNRPFEDRLGMLVDQEFSTRENLRLAARLRHAKLRQQASIEDLDLKAGRGVDRSLVSSLSDSEWINKHRNVLITGPTGVGKSYLGCALAQKACVDGHTVVYHRTSRLFEQLSIARASGAYPRFLNALFKKDLLVFDDFALVPLSLEQRRDLLEILEDRYEQKSTLVISQIPVEQWYESIGDSTFADAILDRLVHNAYKFCLTGESMRKKKIEDKEK